MYAIAAIIYAFGALFVLFYGLSNYIYPRYGLETYYDYRTRVKAGARALFLFWAWPLLILLVAVPAIKRMWADAEF